MNAPAYSTNDSATVICIEQKRAEYMGNPQLDDGHTRIANELLEAILSFPFTSRQYAVVLTIIRKTYGYGKKSDRLAQSVIAEMTGIAKPHVCKTLKELAAMNVIAVDDSNFCHVITLNKGYKDWKSSYQNGNGYQNSSYQNSNELVTKTVTKSLPKQSPQKKERKKENTSGVNFVLPDWIDRESWEGYVAMRKKIRKPITDHAVSLLVKKLDGFRLAGFSVADILNNSTMNCWQGVFEPKVQQQQPRPVNNFGGAL